MSDQKVSALNSLTGVEVTVSTDLLLVVDTSATESKKITLEQLRIGWPISQRSASANTTTTILDAGGHILHPSSDANARVFSIDSNANVAYPLGTAITFVNQVSTVTIGVIADSMTLAGTSTTGNRTLAAGGIASALKIHTTSWIISGTGLS